MINRIKRFIYKSLVSIKYYALKREVKKEIDTYLHADKAYKGDSDYLHINFSDKWKKTFLEYNKYKPKEIKTMLKHFFEENVFFVKKSYINQIPKDEPILICNVKNDLERLKVLVEHHKKIGVKYFAFLDNMSTDGTFEWLQEQSFDVFRVEEQYNSVVRSIWITKIASYYGLDRWFITIDSDELLVYDDFENKGIKEVISCLKSRGIDRGLGFMIDMYAESSDLKATDIRKDIYKTYNLFDVEGYRKKWGVLGVRIHGGPRERYFKNAALMTKYPLFFWRDAEINRYHYIFPIEDKKEQECFFGLLHYKFLDGDYEKIKQIVEDGNYASGSALYKTYLNEIRNNREITFSYEGSKKLSYSSDLLEIDLFKSLWAE